MTGNNGWNPDDIREELEGSPDERSEVISRLAEADDYPAPLVDEIAERLVVAVTAESNAYIRIQGWSILEQMATAYPEGLVGCLPTLIEEMVDAAANLDAGADFTNSPVLSSGSTVIEEVASGLDQHIELDVDSLVELAASQGADPEFRSAVYLLLGQIASVAAIDELVDAYSWELPTVRERIETALGNTRTLVVESLSGTGSLPHQQAVDVVQRLYHSDEVVVPVSEGQLRKVWPNLVADVDAETAEETANLLLIFARDSEATAARIGEELVAQQEAAPTEARAKVLAAYASERTEILEQVVDVMPALEDIDVISEWPAGLSTAEKRIVAGLLKAHAAPISEVLLVRHLADRGETNLPLALLPILETEARSRLRDIASAIDQTQEADLDYFENKEHILYSHIVSAERTVRLSAMNLARELSEWNQGVAVRILQESLNRVHSEDDGANDSWWDLLNHGAHFHPAVIFERIEECEDCLVEGARPDTEQILGLVSRASEHGNPPSTLGRDVLALLDSDRTGTVTAALQAIRAMDFYPPPPPVTELCESSNSAVQKAASRTVQELSNHATIGYRRRVQAQDASVALFDNDSGDLHLKRQTDDGVWCDVGVDSFRQGIIEAVLERVEREENVPLVYPYFEEEEVVLLTVALVLSRPAADLDVTLYSPGSQTQWGMKGEIREELERYGIAARGGEILGATPLPELVPHSYVSGGQIKNKSDGEGPGRIILTKDLEDFGDINRLDIAVMNLISRTEEDFTTQLGDIESDHPDAAFVNAYSYYVRNERDGRPRYGPPAGLESIQTVPGSNLVDSVLSDDDTGADALPSATTDGGAVAWETGVEDVRRLATPSTIRIEKVDASEVEQLLDQVFEESAKLRGVDDYGAGSLIFSRQLFFERLPVTVQEFDNWVRQRYYEGDRFVPPLVMNRIEDVEQKADSVENLQAVQPLNTTVKLLERLADVLETRNPMSERIESHLETALESGQRIALLSESPKHAQILQSALLERGIIQESDLGGTPVSIVSPNDVRGIEHHDRLLVCGALHSENGGFYVHPRVDETVVLTYDYQWTGMIERQATDFIDRLNAVVGGEGYQPYAYPELVGDTELEEPELEADVAEGPADAAPSERPPDVAPSSEMTRGVDSSSEITGVSGSKSELLIDAMESRSTAEYREESGRYERETRHFEVRLRGGDVIEATNHNRFLRKRGASDGKIEYHWVGPDMLSPGDEFATVPDEIETEMWRDRLHELYSDELDADAAALGLHEWYDAMREIWAHVEENLREGHDDPSERAITRTIHQRLQGDPEFDRAEGTVLSWFEGVLEANRPLELAERPELTIGPRNRRDIEAIGRVFDVDRLVENVDDIAGAMRGLRTINRQEGHLYRESLQDLMNADDENRIKDAATHHTVDSVEDVTDE